MDNQSILIIDDEEQIRKILTITLLSNGYEVTEASSGNDGLSKAAHNPPDLILLDLGLPDASGHEILEHLRDWYRNPIIIISVQNSEEEITKALNNGANDFLVKPFRTEELLSRTRSALLKVSGTTNPFVIFYAGLTIDFTNKVIAKGGTVIPLTPTEYSLLSLLAQNEGKVFTHQYLLKEVLGSLDDKEAQYLRVLISEIRKKIENDPNRPAFIRTERGVGYRFSGNKESHTL